MFLINITYNLSLSYRKYEFYILFYKYVVLIKFLNNKIHNVSNISDILIKKSSLKNSSYYFSPLYGFNSRTSLGYFFSIRSIRDILCI